MYEKVKELTEKCAQKDGGSNTDKYGNILFEQEESGKRWVEYIRAV